MHDSEGISNMPIRTAHIFFREWLRSPLQTGSVLPSGGALARTIAQQVEVAGSGTVVELGPGTGAVTRALLDRGIAPERLVLVERNPEFVDLLRRRYPKVRVLSGDAQQLDKLLAEAGYQQVAQAVSSLPLRSLPFAVQRGALRALLRVLAPDGNLLQYTYGLAPPVHPVLGARLHLSGRPVSRILLNVPPAVVWSYVPSAVPWQQAASG
jgi:phosphatidylethanolamine/phosphatidyl-N-methylethanolamine N-methyltransferase